MKKAEVKFTINVPDDFKPGKCSECPLQGYFYGGNAWCKIGFDKTICPVQFDSKKSK